jgi:D-glycerate 3-kinase
MLKGKTVACGGHGARDMSSPRADVTFPGDASAFDLADSLICDTIAATHGRKSRTILVGLSGPQGSGKTTTAARLRNALGARGLNCAVLSLDDFYLTRAQRAQLAATVHPLLATRGVPGTHDVPMMTETLKALATAQDGQTTRLPAFDKAQDDRAPQDDWPTVHGRPDVIILEGWCVGAAPQPASALAAPINDLEAAADPDGAWRTYVNDQLEGPYRAFFASFDLMTALIAPSFECVYAWRAQQETALRLRSPDGRHVMSETQLARFIAHYERITRAMIDSPQADLLIALATDRRPISAARPEGRHGD